VFLLFYVFHHNWDNRHIPPHPAVFPLGRSLTNFFCPGLPRPVILQISASRVARVTGMSHWHPPSMSQCLTQIFLKKEEVGTSFESTQVSNKMKMIFLSIITVVILKDDYYVKLAANVKESS
jgi:hypothetical protein